MTACARCERVLARGESRRVPAYVRAPAVVAAAFFHGGMWAHEHLSSLFCVRCRRVIVAQAVLLAALVLTTASFGVAVWLRGPRR